MLSVETRSILCKKCSTVKTAYLASTYPDGKNKKWKDENGKLFNGKVCPDCHKSHMKEHVKGKRANGQPG